MKTLTTQTVKEYNATQTSRCMMIENKDGSLSKRGYVVSFDDIHKFCKTLKEAKMTTEKDFIKKESPIWYNADCGMSNLEYINQ